VTSQTTDALEQFHFADAARVLYDFAWNEFCSFYVEMVKARLGNPATRPTAQRVLAHTLDTLLRLLHPLAPFVTEEVWQLLGEAAPERGLPEAQAPAESVMIAAWPVSDPRHVDPHIEAQFARFQEVLGGLREIRSRQNIPPKTPIEFTVRCDAEAEALLKPMEPYFNSMAGASSTAWGKNVEPPAASASFAASGLDVFVDLADFIDVEAEIVRLTKELARLDGAIAGKQKQLANENFVSRAPAEVIQKERAALVQLTEQRAATAAGLEAMKLRK
jgi:valyl-tRNA synthetase